MKYQLLFSALLISSCQCQAIFEAVGNAYYYIGTKNVTSTTSMAWFESRRSCQENGGQLVSVQTEAQMMELQEYLLRRGYPNGSSFSTSGNSFESQSPFQWCALEERVTFTKWLPENGPQPNSFLSLQLVDSELFMITSIGSDPFYICEYESLPRKLWIGFHRYQHIYLAVIFIFCLLFLFTTLIKRNCQAKKNHFKYESV